MGAVTTNPPITGFPYISNAVRITSVPGLTFGDLPVDNTTRFVAAIADAVARNKFVLLDFADRGPLCLASGIVTMNASMYGDSGGPKPEIWLTGGGSVTSNGLVLSATPNLEYKNFVIRKTKAESRKISSWSRDVAGIVTVTFQTAHRWVIGDNIQVDWVDTFGQSTRTVLSVPNSVSITYDSGVVGSAASFDPTLAVLPTSVRRKNNYIYYTYAATAFRQGMKIGTLVPAANFIDTTTVLSGTATIAIGAANTVVITSFTGGDTTNLVGYRVTALNGAIPEGVVIAVGGSNSMSIVGVATIAGSTTLTVSREPMTFASKPAARVISSTQLAIEDPGPDDVSVSIGSGVRLQAVSTDQWACVRGNRNSFNAPNQWTFGGYTKPFFAMENVNIYGVGCLYQSDGSRIWNCAVRDTPFDGWHIDPVQPSTTPGPGNSRHHIRNLTTYDTRDDALAFVGYASQVTAQTNIVVEGGIFERSTARGIVVTGASNTVVDGAQSLYCGQAGVLVEEGGTYRSQPVVKAMIRNVTVVGCGNWQSTPNYTAPGPAVSITGGFDVTFVNLRVLNAHGRGIQITGVPGKLTVVGSEVDWTYEEGVDFSLSAGGGDLKFDGLQIRESGKVAFSSNGTNNGRGKLEYSLILADIGWRNEANGTTRGVDLQTWRGNTINNGVRWKDQQFAGVDRTFLAPTVGTMRTLLVGAAQPPAGIQPTASTSMAWQEPGAMGESVVLVASGAFNFVAGDYPLKLTAEAELRGFLPVFWETRHSAVLPNSMNLTTNANVIEVRTLPGIGLGTQLFATTHAFRSQRAFTYTLVGRPDIQIYGDLVNTSAIISGNWRSRIDDVEPGWAVTGTNVPVNSIIAGVDRKSQRMIMAVNTGTFINQYSCSIALNSTALTTASSSGVAVGYTVFGDGVQAGTTISSGAGTAWVMSAAATQTTNVALLTFVPAASLATATGTAAGTDLTFACGTPGTSFVRSASVRVGGTVTGANTGGGHIANVYGILGKTAVRSRVGVTFNATAMAIAADTTAEAVIGAVTANITALPNPTGTTLDADLLRLEFVQDATGGWTISGWGTEFSKGQFPNLPGLVPGAANARMTCVFKRVVGTVVKWMLVDDSGWDGVGQRAPQTIANSATPAAVNFNTTTVALQSLVAQNTTIAAPTGAFTEDDLLTLSFTKDATASLYTLTWNAVFVAGAGGSLPLTFTATASTKIRLDFRFLKNKWTLERNSTFI